MPDQNEYLLRFRAACRQHHLKITPQRTAIYFALRQSNNHPTAAAIHQKVIRQFPSISFDTINRTLLTFSKIGLLEPVEQYAGPRRFDPSVKTHHHFCCISCGDIIDFNCNGFDRLKIPAAIQKKHHVIGGRLVLKGVCVRCKG